MKKFQIFVYLMLAFSRLGAWEHTITKIFDEGKAIQLNDGSIWAIGYWSWNDFLDQPKAYH